MNLRQQPAWLVWSAGLSLGVALTWMAYAWVVVPNHERAQKADETNAAAQTQRSTALQLEAQVDELAGLVTQRRDTLDDMPMKLGDRRRLNHQIASLIELAQERKLEVLQLQPGKTTPGEHYDLTALKLEAVAGFPEHLAYLDALHAAFPDVSVVGLELRSNPRADAPRPRAVYELVWFTKVDEGTLSRADRAGDR